MMGGGYVAGKVTQFLTNAADCLDFLRAVFPEPGLKTGTPPPGDSVRKPLVDTGRAVAEVLPRPGDVNQKAAQKRGAVLETRQVAKVVHGKSEAERARRADGFGDEVEPLGERKYFLASDVVGLSESLGVSGRQDHGPGGVVAPEDLEWRD